MAVVRIGLLHLMLLVCLGSTVSGQNSAREGIPERFSTFTFDRAAGRVPIGWERGYSPKHELRMRPAGHKTQWLDMSLVKLENMSRESLVRKLLEGLRKEDPRLSEPISLGDGRMYAWKEQAETDSDGFLTLSRSWYLALRASHDSTYMLVGTASESLPRGRSSFAPEFIAAAERAVLGVRIR